MTSAEVRQKFLDFFAGKDHEVVPSSPLVPGNDPTLRFKGKLFLKSDWKPEMLRKIYESYNDKIVDLYLKKEISSPIPTLKQIVK